MMIIEVFTPKGTLTGAQRRVLGARLVTDVMQAGGSEAPEAVIDAGRSLCHVLFREADDWYVAGHPLQADALPPYLIRVAVPESWREEMASHLVTAFTKVLADIDENPARLYEQPVSWIHVTGLPDGAIGSMGQALTATDLLKIITKPHRESPRSAADLPPGSGLDPVCGMTVPFEHAAATVEHNGTRIPFCSKGCHEVFAEEHAR
ncbi:YHS domain-containing protein [Amycolatopsis rhizosphaerae]|uniref:YHS domain-containing protein n=1 Tax=Amycolatopsis rhizosphaerae TaxID=2053003 RepID=A0A558DKV4_9PSEU|nr:YHS domain-containing protein [Amycolatopsis rhizosphaerae]TVT61656.1 YHS domain-containing protein [Amycolatopsis rhizosphaerae]